MAAPTAILAPPPPIGLIERQFRCANCLGVAPEREYRYGRGRWCAEHEEHRYCPACGVSIDWNGYGVVKVEASR